MAEPRSTPPFGLSSLRARVAAWLPEGSSLPAQAWRQRHLAIRTIIWLHVAAVPIFALTRGANLAHGMVEALPVAAFGLLAGWNSRSRKFRAGAAALALLSASAILVHLSGGTIEMHFHFFVMIGVLTMYQDWLPFLLAIGYVVVHHGLFGLLWPEDVFNHPAATAAPLKWALIHALFVLAASAAYLVAWRMNEHSRAELADSARQLQDQRRQLLDRTMEATEQERKRLSAELHDGPVQHLAALDVYMETLQHSLKTADTERADRLIRRTQVRLREEVGALRRMMTQLRPPILDERGLAAALSDHLNEVRRQSGVDGVLDCTLPSRVDPEVETVLYRVAQEAVTNVVKHAGADKAWLSLYAENGSVVLEVRDHGAGFDLNGATEIAGGNRFGMIGMRERVEMAGGRWEVDSTPGAGTRIRAIMPRGANR